MTLLNFNKFFKVYISWCQVWQKSSWLIGCKLDQVLISTNTIFRKTRRVINIKLFHGTTLFRRMLLLHIHRVQWRLALAAFHAFLTVVRSNHNFVGAARSVSFWRRFISVAKSGIFVQWIYLKRIDDVLEVSVSTVKQLFFVFYFHFFQVNLSLWIHFCIEYDLIFFRTATRIALAIWGSNCLILVVILSFTCHAW